MMTAMSNQPSHPVRGPRQIPQSQAIALMAVVAVLGVVLLVLANEGGRSLGDEVGGWIGWGVTYLVLGGVWLLMAMRFTTHPPWLISLLGGVLLGISAGEKAQETVLSAAPANPGVWAMGALFGTYLAVFVLWMLLVYLVAKPRRS
jgi:hypothetical protein